MAQTAMLPAPFEGRPSARGSAALPASRMRRIPIELVSWRSRLRAAAVLAVALPVLAIAACTRSLPRERPEAPPSATREMLVTAHAYNSVRSQTDAQPTLTASGERLKPGMRAIAVSEDLLAMGLGYGTQVSIDGLGDGWVVRDRMASRKRRSIDVYLGNDEAAARRFGKRKLRISWPAR